MRKDSTLNVSDLFEALRKDAIQQIKLKPLEKSIIIYINYGNKNVDLTLDLLTKKDEEEEEKSDESIENTIKKLIKENQSLKSKLNKLEKDFEDDKTKMELNFFIIHFSKMLMNWILYIKD